MLGVLQYTVNIDGTEYKLNTDYHIALIIFQAMEDPNLSGHEKMYIMLSSLYEDFENMPPEHYEEAIEQANMFLNGGEICESRPQQKQRLFSWTQDSNIIFSAVNKVAGKELRDPNIHEHWWTFLAYMDNIGESTFATYIGIRKKLQRHKTLDPWEKEIYNNNQDKIKLKPLYSDAEQDHYDKLNKMFGGG